MLRSLTDLKGFAIGATDGDIGHITDLYFDDANWTVRYLVVESGAWLASRKILITPLSVTALDGPDQRLTVSITKDQVRSSPQIDMDRPVSRQHEMHLLSHYRYPNYWERSGAGGQGAYPPMIGSGLAYGGTTPEYRRGMDERARLAAVDARQRHEHDDAHLRSSGAALKSRIHATDGDIGFVQDFLFDDRTWAVRYVIVDTGKWWDAHPVLIDPRWIDTPHWTASSMPVRQTRAFVNDAPSYSAAAELLGA
jgi:PRC-barrel domain